MTAHETIIATIKSVDRDTHPVRLADLIMWDLLECGFIIKPVPKRDMKGCNSATRKR